MSTFFENELFKMVISFDDVNGLSDYEVETPSDTPSSKYIQTVKANLSDGNRGDNPLGNMSSGRCYISLFDDDDTVNPMNSESEYSGYMTPGRRATVYKSKDGETWSRYFGGLITDWQGSFKDGLHNITTIKIEDDLNTIGAMDISDLVYTGSSAADALMTIFAAFGISPSNVVLDSSLLNIPYTHLLSPARRTINDICYQALTYIQIRQDGKIYVSRLNSFITSHVYNVTGDDIGNTEPTKTAAVNYNKVKVTYLSGDDLTYQLIASKSDIVLENGNNTILLDAVSKPFTIESVSLTVNEGVAAQEYNDVTYSTADNLITVNINAVLDSSKTGRLRVYGLTKGGAATSQVTVSLPDSTTGILAETYEYNNNNVIASQEATQMANRIANFILSLRKQIKIGTSFLSPDIQVGDIIILSDISPTYNGTYRVSEINFEYGDTYNVGVTLLKAYN